MGYGADLVQIPVFAGEWVVPTLLHIRELWFLAFPRVRGWRLKDE